MTCAEARELIPLLAVDALEPAERAALERQLAACPHCREEAAVAQAAFDSLTPSDEALPPLSGELRERVMAEVHRAGFTRVEDVAEAGKQAKRKGAPEEAADAAQVERVARQITLTCIYCHDGIARPAVAFCAACLAPHHGECFRGNGRCAAPGCEEIRHVRPSDAQPLPPPRRRGGVGFVLGMLVAGSAAAAVAAWSRAPVELSEPSEPARVVVAPPPEPDPQAWQLLFDEASEVQLAALRAAIAAKEAPEPGPEAEREARARVERAIDAIESTCRAALQAASASPEATSRVRELLRRAEEAFPASRVDAQRVHGSEMRPIDVDADDADLRQVMERIGRQVGRNILVDPNVQETVRVSLRGIPWRKAVEAIARMTRCQVEERPGGLLLLTQPPKVTIQFTDSNVRTTLQLLAAYSGKNIVLAPDVRGTVTMDFEEVHWLRAIQAIARSLDLAVIEEDENLLVIMTRSGFERQQAEPLELELLIERLRALNTSGALVTLTLQRAGLQDVCRSVEEQAGCTLTIESDAEHFLSVELVRAPWREAVRVIARQLDLDLRETTRGALMRERERNHLAAYRAPVRVWLAVLAELGGFALELEDGGTDVRLDTNLAGLSYELAAEATLRSVGWAFREHGGVLRVRPRPGAQTLAPFLPQELELQDGTQLRLTLQGVIQTEQVEARRALIDGVVYRPGDRLRLGGLMVEEIGRGDVQLREDGGPVHTLEATGLEQ